MKHYAQTTEADMNEAAKMAILNDAEKTVHPTMETFGNVQQQNQEDEIDTSNNPCNSRNLLKDSISRNSLQKIDLWARLDSNQRPTDYESVALTN